MQSGNSASPLMVSIVDPASGTVMTGTAGVIIQTGTGTQTISGTVTVANPVSTVTVANPVNSVTVSGTVTNVQASQYVQTAGFTQITTNGTTTVKSGSGVFFGINPIAIGVTASVSAFDGTAALIGTGALSLINGLINAGPSGVGVRFGTSLLVVTAGVTPATVNALWD